MEPGRPQAWGNRPTCWRLQRDTVAREDACWWSGGTRGCLASGPEAFGQSCLAQKGGALKFSPERRQPTFSKLPCKQMSVI